MHSKIIMKLRVLFCSTLVCSLAFAASQSDSRPVSATSASEIPHLRKQGAATQLIVDGKPFLALAGELLNSSATSLEYMKSVWSKLAEGILNTLLPGVSWNQVEPQEGKFNFSVVQVGNYTLESAYLTPPVMPANLPPRETTPTSAAILIATGPDEYFVAGSGVKVTFSSNTPGTPLAGLGTVEEGTFVNGRWVPGRQLAGDDTGQGDYVGLWGHWKSAGWPGDVGPENLFLRDLSIQRVTLYRYR